MINKTYKIPLVYKIMDDSGFTNSNNNRYLWLNEMEWIPIRNQNEEKFGSKDIEFIIPFAFTGSGDRWVWIVNNYSVEYNVGLCETGEETGIYYAKNTEDAILKQIIEYVSDSNFYLEKQEAKTYQINEFELKKRLLNWSEKFRGILRKEYINVINELSELHIKKVESIYGKWYALLSIEERKQWLDKHIAFELAEQEF